MTDAELSKLWFLERAIKAAPHRVDAIMSALDKAHGMSGVKMSKRFVREVTRLREKAGTE